MRISFILSSLELSGGVLLVGEYARRLADRGHSVALVVPGDSVDPQICAELSESVAIIESTVALEHASSLLGRCRLTLSLVKSLPPSDVVVATHTPTTVPAMLAAIPRKHCHLVWLYMDYPEMFAGRPTEAFLLRHAPGYFDLIATISKPLAERVSAHTRRPVFVSGSGLPRAHLFSGNSGQTNGQSDRPPERDGSTQRLFYLGDNRPRKGLSTVLAASEQVYRQLPGIRLVIASKVAISVETQVPHELYHAPADKVLVELYQTSDLFVSASWGEGLGYPPLEAMACGTPVVASDSVGVRDYAIDGVNCMLVPPKDSGALAEAILTVLTDRHLSAGLVHGGYKTVQFYEWESTVDRFEARLRSLCCGL